MSRTDLLTSKLLFGLMILLLVSLPLVEACARKSEERPPDVITPVPAQGFVKLPEGSSLALSDLRVLSCLEETSIESDGSFSVLEPGNGVAAVGLADAEGKIVLVGYVDASAPGGSISAETTAIWLLSRAFSSLLSSSVPRADLIDLLSATEEAKQLAQVITDRVAANPTAITDGDEQIIAAVDAAVTSLQVSIGYSSEGLSERLTASQPLGSLVHANDSITGNVETAYPLEISHIEVLPDGVTVSQIYDEVLYAEKELTEDAEPQQPAKLIVEGGEQSGVVVTSDTSSSAQPDVNGFVVANNRRRHLWYFVYRVGYEDKNGEYHAVEPPEKVSLGKPDVPFFAYCPAVSGYSGVIGTLSDVLLQDMPLTEETSLPVELYMNPPDAAKTKYVVVVTGPGTNPYSDEFAEYLPGEVRAKYTEEIRNTYVLMSAMTLVGEVVLPLVLDFLPDGFIQSGLDTMPTNIVIPTLKITEEQVEAATKAGYGWLTNLGNGDFKGAANSLIKLVVDNDVAREAFVQSIVRWLFSGQGDVALLNSTLKNSLKILKVMQVLDKALQVLDFSTVLSHVVKSDPAEYWSVTAVPAVVRLDPNPASVGPGDTVDLKASSPGVSGLLVWRFSCSNNNGHLRKWDDTDQTGEFDSSKPEVTYVANEEAQSGDSDIVTVEAYLKEDGELRSLGEASAKVEIGDAAWIEKIVLVNIIRDTFIKVQIIDEQDTVLIQSKTFDVYGIYGSGGDKVVVTAFSDLKFIANDRVRIKVIETTLSGPLLTRIVTTYPLEAGANSVKIDLYNNRWLLSTGWSGGDIDLSWAQVPIRVDPGDEFEVYKNGTLIRRYVNNEGIGKPYEEWTRNTFAEFDFIGNAGDELRIVYRKTSPALPDDEYYQSVFYTGLWLTRLDDPLTKKIQLTGNYGFGLDQTFTLPDFP